LIEDRRPDLDEYCPAAKVLGYKYKNQITLKLLGLRVFHVIVHSQSTPVLTGAGFNAHHLVD
jgi:hypothetical protein